MQIEGYEGMIGSVILAKELHDIGRFDMVQSGFFDTLSWDSGFQNMYSVITDIFSGYYSDYDDGNEFEVMVFTDDYISRYFEIAHEYGRSHNVSHDSNPYVIEANREAERWLTFCFSIGFKLLGYTKTRKTAKQSKLVVYSGDCTCDCHGSLARALIELYKFFRDKCVDFDKKMAVIADKPNLHSEELKAA